MRLIIAILIVLGLISIVGGLSSIYVYRKGMYLWECKKDKLNIKEKLQGIFYVLIETKIFQRDKDYIKAATMHLAEEAYDYMVVREPGIEIANQILKERTVLEILDFWDSPLGRVLKIKIGATEHHRESIIMISMKSIEKEALKIKKTDKSQSESKGPKLRIIK